MCGVFIVVSKKNQLDIEKCRLCLDSLDHRGPDYKFDLVFNNKKIFMGQTILSITGKPQVNLNSYHCSNSGRYNIVFNGEIYNYKKLQSEYLRSKHFFTQSDTEVLVNLFDYLNPKKIAKLLRGMYAFGCYDKQKNFLYIFRDLIGEKILYKFEDDQSIIFSSEIKPILSYIQKFKVDMQKLYEYFFSRHLLTNTRSTFQKITPVVVGSAFKIDINKFRTEQIFQEQIHNLVDKNLFNELNSMKENEILDEFNKKCLSSARTILPEVNFSSVVSGGVDSSMASWYMQEASDEKDINFVTLKFGLKDEASRNIEQFSKYFQKPILSKEVVIEEFAKEMTKFYEKYSIIASTHSFISQIVLSGFVKSLGNKVLIGGDGADELFGGYDYYKNFHKITKIPRFNPSPYSGYTDLSIKFDDFDNENFFRRKAEEWEEVLEIYKHIKDDKGRTLQSILLLDSSRELETVGLRSADLMSMTNSVESRSFFVTREMIEFAVNLPIRYKIDLNSNNKNFVTKPILKKNFIKIFEENLLFDKQGYSGFPNEAASLILKNNVSSFTTKFKPIFDPENKTHAMDWKFFNTELFLRSLKTIKI